MVVEVQRRKGSSHSALRKHFMERKGTLNCICQMGRLGGTKKGDVSQGHMPGKEARAEVLRPPPGQAFLQTLALFNHLRKCGG